MLDVYLMEFNIESHEWISIEGPRVRDHSQSKVGLRLSGLHYKKIWRSRMAELR